MYTMLGINTTDPIISHQVTLYDSHLSDLITMNFVKIGGSHIVVKAPVRNIKVSCAVGSNIVSPHITLPSAWGLRWIFLPGRVSLFDHKHNGTITLESGPDSLFCCGHKGWSCEDADARGFPLWSALALAGWSSPSVEKKPEKSGRSEYSAPALHRITCMDGEFVKACRGFKYHMKD